MMKEVTPSRYFMGCLAKGSDLLEELTVICEKENIQIGGFEAIGAVQKACFGFYNQFSRKYNFKEIHNDLEILKCSGNISLNEGKPMIHAHIIFTDENGHAFGGHLAKGTVVFSCEYIIQAFDNSSTLKREFDPKTGLRLWKE